MLKIVKYANQEVKIKKIKAAAILPKMCTTKPFLERTFDDL
jgi:hypothetical protein